MCHSLDSRGRIRRSMLDSPRSCLASSPLIRSRLRTICPSTIFEDNQGTIALAESVYISRRSKHIDVRFHFVRDKIQRGDITLQHVPSSQQLSDIFTKPLTTVAFRRIRDLILCS